MTMTGSLLTVSELPFEETRVYDVVVLGQIADDSLAAAVAGDHRLAVVRGGPGARGIEQRRLRAPRPRRSGCATGRRLPQ